MPAFLTWSRPRRLTHLLLLDGARMSVPAPNEGQLGGVVDDGVLAHGQPYIV